VYVRIILNGGSASDRGGNDGGIYMEGLRYHE